MDGRRIDRARRPLATLVFVLTVPAAAHEHSPRVLSPHVADTHSLKTFAEFDGWKGLDSAAKIQAIFRYLADRRTGIYPLGVPAWEGPADLNEFGAVRDPVKMLNVYPIGHCGTLGPTAAGIFEGMGIGRARALALPGFNHVVSEVFHGGRWSYVDLDLRAVFRRSDGSLASMEEAQRDPSLWRGPNGPLFFPLDSLEAVRREYEKTAVEPRYGFYTSGHTMDFILRQGETFTRWWKPQGGRWSHHSSYGAHPFPREIIEKEPRGPKCKHPSFTVHTHGNGRFIYRPDLTESSSDFEDGVYDSRSIRPCASGLTLAEPGEGFAVFEVRSGYVIAPLVGDLDTPGDDLEASVVRLDASRAALSISLDSGVTWTEMGAAQASVDLTREVSGSYGYLLRVTLRGKPEEAILRSLEITTWVQLHPASLPSLRKGPNRMRYVRGDHHGLDTHVMEVRSRGEGRVDFLKHLVEPSPDFDPSRKTCRAIGPFTVQVFAPPGSRIAWLSAGGSFNVHQGNAAPRSRNSIAYAVEEPQSFRTLYESDVPAGHAHWHTNGDREVRLDPPARRAFLRYVGDPGVNHYRAFAHCLRDRPCGSSVVQITHAWIEKGERKAKTVPLEGPGEYELVAAEEPEDESVEISVASRRRAR